MIKEMIDLISAKDREIAAAVEQELWRQKNHIELIASENFVSPAVLAASGTVLTNKYAEGYPSRRYYGGCEYVDVVEAIAIDRAKRLFNAGFANVQPHSGAQANFAAYLALCEPGDTILGMDLGHGGHLTHGSSANFSGKLYNIISYGVNSASQTIDYDRVRSIALRNRPKMIIAGASAYPRVIDFKAFGEIARECGAYLMVDMAHIAGLVAAGEHPSPMEHAAVVTTTTHKTLRGPRGGLILTNHEDIAKKINSAVFPGSQGGPLMHVIAAKAVAFGEALEPEFIRYQKQVVKNSRALADGLISRGHDLVSGGTDNHLALMDLRRSGLSGREMEERLDTVRITVNKNKIPDDPAGAMDTSGIRLGSPAVTSRGFREAEMDEVAQLISMAVRDIEKTQDEITERVLSLCRRFPLYSEQ